MILPDVSVLIHAHNSDSPVHGAACHWWDRCLAGTEGIGLPWVVLLGFLRIATHPRVLERPLPVDDVFDRFEEWLGLAHVHIATPSDRHFVTLREALERVGVAGNLTTDAHLATIAINRGYVLYSTDVDFSRFTGLTWRNPIAG